MDTRIPKLSKSIKQSSYDSQNQKQQAQNMHRSVLGPLLINRIAFCLVFLEDPKCANMWVFDYSAISLVSAINH